MVSTHRSSTAGSADVGSAPRPAGEPPETLPGFERIGRSWDAKHGCYVARLLPGELYVTRDDEMITTVLGSCIAACVTNLAAGVGGMNHFMLPTAVDGADVDAHQAARYGSYAMEALLNNIMKYGRASRDFQVKLFGGGKMIAMMTDIGGRNIEFVKRYLKSEGIAVVAEDLGSVYPRKVNYFPKTGRAMVKRLRPLHTRLVAEQEQAHLRTLTRQPARGDVELF